MQLDHWIGEKIKQWQKCEENVGYLIYNYSPKASIKRAIFAKELQLTAFNNPPSRELVEDQTVGSRHHVQVI